MKIYVFLIFIIFNSKLYSQYIYCSQAKYSKIDTISPNHFRINSNYTPFKIIWKRNQQVLKTLKNKYNPKKSTYSYSDLYPIPPYYNSKIERPFGNYPFLKYPSNCFFIHKEIYYYLPEMPYTWNSIYGYNSTRSAGKEYYIYKKRKKNIPNDLYVPIDSFRPQANALNYLEDSFIRGMLQVYVSDTLLYIMDENIVKIDESNVSFIKYPKISIVCSNNGRFIKNISLNPMNYSLRIPTSNNNLKYTNFFVMNDKLYLSYSFKNNDSMGIYNLKNNKWENFIGLKKDNIFPSFFHSPQNFPYYSPLGNSRVSVSKKNTIFIAEWLGDIYKFDNQFNKQILLHKKDSNLFGTIDENTRSFCIDGYDNLYLPDSKKGRVVRLEKDSTIPEILIDSFYGYCGVYYTNTPDSTLFSPTNIQFDCNGNIIMETERKDPTIVCDTRFHYKFDSYIEDTILLNTPLNACDTLIATVYFIDGDSIVNIITKPPCYISKSVQVNSCDSFKFNKKTYYQSEIYTDTAISSIKPDTIYTLNLIVNKSKFDTIKAQTCNTYKFGDSIYSKSGTYTHKFTAKNGCDSLSTLILDSKEVNATVKLENGIFYTALTPNASYQWHYCYPWRRITNAQYQTFSTITKGSYAVVVSHLGCTDTSDCIALYSSGLQLLQDNEIIVYPNPTRDIINIKIGNNFIENQIEIYNPIGQKINSITTKSSEIQVDLKNEAKGIYLIKVNEINIFRIRKE